MEDNKLDNNLYEPEISNEKSESIFYRDLMVQKVEKKKCLNLPKEISNRIKKLDRMFISRFGKYFLDIKPESLVIFERQFRKYYFSPHSKFLYNFPDLRKKLYFDKNINIGGLGDKINVGSLLYLSETDKLKDREENVNKKEKLFSFSKNFTTNVTKDVVSNEIYKIKFLDKNKKRINNILNKKYHERNSSIYQSEDERKSDNFTRYYSKTSENFDINTNIQNNKNNFKNEKIKLKNHFSFSVGPIINNKIEEEKFDENEKKNIKYLKKNDYINTESIIINDNSQNNIINSNYMINSGNYNNTINNSYLNNLRYYNINKSFQRNNNLKSEVKNESSSFPSINLNINESNYKTTYNFNNNNKNKLNISRNHIYLKDKNINHKSLFHSTYNNYKNLVESSIRYTKNLNKQVKELKTHTMKCNSKLYKLIDGNYVINSKEKNEKQNAFDINQDLSEDNSNKKKKKSKDNFFDFYEYEKLISKSSNKNNISSLLKEVNDNFFDKEKFKKKQLQYFPKNIIKMNDEYALRMVERLYSANKIRKQKEPDVDTMSLREKEELKNKKKIITLRKQAKINHEKIIKMGISLTKEKDKFYKKNKKAQKKK